jgi:hypothetical protein
MQGFYNILSTIKGQLELDPMVNTVTYGDIFDVDLAKQTIFPLSHIIVNEASMEGNTWRFNITVICMDVLDISKDESEPFVGNDNEQDILNTQLAVINRLCEVLRRGDIRSDLYHLDGSVTCEPFTERFENNLTGWAATFDIIIPNNITIC